MFNKSTFNEFPGKELKKDMLGHNEWEYPVGKDRREIDR